MASDVSSSRPTYRVAFALPPADLEVWEAESDYTPLTPTVAIEAAQQTALRVVATGTPSSTTPLEVESARGGFAGGSAAFRWRPATTPASGWRQWHGPAEYGDAEALYVGTESPATAIGGCTRRDGRIVVAIAATATGERIRVIRETTDGTFASVVVAEVVMSAEIDAIDVVELPNGTLDLYVDIDGIQRWRSTDGGATWDWIPTGVGGVWSGEEPTEGGSASTHVVVAGDDTGRMLMFRFTATLLFQYASEDYGDTWEEIAFNTVTPEAMALTFDPGSGFLWAGPDGVVTVVDPFVEVAIVGGGSTLFSRSFVRHGQDLLLHWLAPSPTPGKQDLSAWSTGASSQLGTDSTALVGLALGGRTCSWVITQGGTTASVWARRAGGWGTHPTTRSSDLGLTWASDWLPYYGADTPDDMPDDTGGSWSGGGTLTSAMLGTYWRLTGGVASGDGNNWVYTQGGGGALTWIAEIDVELTAGRIEIETTTDRTRTWAVIDGDAGTVGLYEGATRGAAVLVGSTSPLPAGRVTVRVYTEQRSSSDGRGSIWLRSHESVEWTTVADEEALTMAGGGTYTERVEYNALEDGGGFAADVYGCRTNEFFTSLSAMDRFEPTRWGNRARYLQDGISVQAQAGGLTRYGDSWTVTPGHSDGAGQLLTTRAPSPREGFVGSDDTTQTIAFRAPRGESVPAHALLVDRTNVRDLQVYAYVTDAWVDYGTVTLAQPIAAYTKLGTYTVVLGSATATTANRQPLVQDALARGTFVDSADVAHEIEGSSEGVLVTSGGYAGRRVVLTLATEPASSGAGEIWWPRVTAILHHEAGAPILGIKVDLVPGTLTGDDVVGGQVRCGTCCVAPITWIAENPDETATTVQECREELIELPGGHRTQHRTEPDRRRWDLQWTRLLPRYTAMPGDHDWWRAMTSTPETAPAATAWSTPEVLGGFLAAAGRRPFVFLPAVDFYVGGAGEVQSLGSTYQSGHLVRYAGESYRLEGVHGHLGTADQLVRTPTISLVEEA